MLYKPGVRRRLREKRKQLTHESIQQASNQVATQCISLPEFLDAEKIGYYISQENELDPSPLIDIASTQNKQLYLPATVINDDDKLLQFYAHNKEDLLITNELGIQEPQTNGRTPVNIGDIDIVFVPLVGFDKHRNRLGRGAGFYDQTFACINDNPNTKRPLLIGLAYEFQKIEDLEPAEWDVPLDTVITEQKIY